MSRAASFEERVVSVMRPQHAIRVAP
jgi:hypothetical protein